MTVQNIKHLLLWWLFLGMSVKVSAAQYEVDGQLEQTIYEHLKS